MIIKIGSFHPVARRQPAAARHADRSENRVLVLVPFEPVTVAIAALHRREHVDGAVLEGTFTARPALHQRVTLCVCVRIHTGLPLRQALFALAVAVEARVQFLAEVRELLAVVQRAALLFGVDLIIELLGRVRKPVTSSFKNGFFLFRRH